MRTSHLLDEKALTKLDERFPPFFAGHLRECVLSVADRSQRLRDSDPRDTLKAKIVLHQLIEMIDRSEQLDMIARLIFRNGKADLEKFRAWLTREWERGPRTPIQKLPKLEFKLEVALAIACVFLFHKRKLTVWESLNAKDEERKSEFMFAVEVALLALGRNRGDIKRLCFQAQKIIKTKDILDILPSNPDLL